MKNVYHQHLQQGGTWENFGNSVDSPYMFYITHWHYEGRDAKNVNLPSSNGIIDREDLETLLAEDGWILLDEDQSIFHDNGIGKPEMKFIHPDGREVVFDGDTGATITDPRYKGTYNYVSIGKKPEAESSIGEKIGYAFRWIGHGLVDVIPYKLGGDKNERTQ